MSNDRRILFMGTPDFAVHILDSILKDGKNVVGVVTVPDKPSGRGQKMNSSAVAKYAKKHNLNLIQPEKLKSQNFIDEIKALNVDVSVVVAFRMLPKEIWALPKLGTFNLHASLLPQYRGAAPINHAIMNGDKISGVTTFLIDDKIDTGNILMQKEVEILPEDDAGILHDKLMNVGADLVIETLNGLDNNSLIPQPQKIDGEVKYASKIFKEDCLISWDRSIEDINNFIRGLSPYPVAWTYLADGNSHKVFKIYNVNIEKTTHDYPLHHVFQKDKKLGVAHRDGIIWLNDIQLEGKRRMNAIDFLNGNNLSVNAFVKSEK